MTRRRGSGCFQIALSVAVVGVVGGAQGLGGRGVGERVEGLDVGVFRTTGFGWREGGGWTVRER